MEFHSSRDDAGSSAKQSSGRSRTNTLAREGIVPVKEQRATSGSKFGKVSVKYIRIAPD